MLEKLKGIFETFELVDYYDNWKNFSKPYYIFKNQNYKGGETVFVESSPVKIIKFIKDLKAKNIEYLNFISRVELYYHVGNEFRGWGGSESYIFVDKQFAEKINLQGEYQWIDRGWGDYYAEIKYDLSKLS